MGELLLFGHVVGAILWVGGGLIGALLMLRMRGAGTREKLTILDAMERLEPIFPIGAALVIGLGVWMVVDSAVIGFGDLWLLIAYGAIILSGLLQAVVTPRLRRTRQLLEANDPTAHEEWATVSWIVPIDSLLLLTVVWAMIFKPGL